MTERFFNIKVIPRSSRNKIIKESESFWRVKLTTAPVEGKANQALIKLLAKRLSVSKSQIAIVQGLRSKVKRIKVAF